MFTDVVTLRVRAGHGGRGSASFRAQPFEPQGGPDGGNGGAGGHVILEASRELDDLSSLAGRRLLSAADGQAGAGGRKEGRRGADLTIRVPVGTAIYEEDGELLADLIQEGQRAVVARGGAAGGGNVHRVSSVNRTPTAAGPGEPGQQRDLRLELRLPATIALVGRANAGKSTLLSALTAARPKIAPYPNTTQKPELGVMFSDRGEPITVVEIPDERFQRHLDRARLVVLVVDATDQAGIDDLKKLAGDRPTLVVRTKSDLVAGARRRKGLWISAETGEGLDELRQALIAAHDDTPVVPHQPLPGRRVQLAPTVRATAISVARKEWGLEVVGSRLERLLERYDLETPAGFDRFQLALDRMGVTLALEEAGAQPGETVRIGESEFEYQP
jgi:GTP-binding protein